MRRSVASVHGRERAPQVVRGVRNMTVGFRASYRTILVSGDFGVNLGDFSEGRVNEVKCAK